VGGIPAIAANATSTAAVCPGALASAVAYRHDLSRFTRRQIVGMVAISLVGGFAGAMLLLLTPQAVFESLIPWLLLSATLLFAGGKRVAAVVSQRVRVGTGALIIGQLVISVYGGYFGAGIGILMLGMMTVAGMTDLNAMNGIKALLSGCLNAVAVSVFIVAHQVYWRPAILMAVAAIVGGYAGGAIARRVDQRHVRVIVILIGIGMTAYFFIRG
jgi:uncharacterized protein